MKQIFLYINTVMSVSYLNACAQERLVFFPESLEQNYRFEFNYPYSEYNIEVENGIRLNGLLFKNQSHNHQNVILYLHGNAGSNARCGSVSAIYLENGYDVFMLDYRGFGKSNGRIQNEEVLYQDIQKGFNFLKSLYLEKNIVILGYSLGTGLAAKLAADNHPRALILLAPYYSLPDVVQSHFFFVPKFLVKFKIPTYQYLSFVDTPIYIFHGEEDNIIYPRSSEKLKKSLKKGDQVIFLEQQGHDNIEQNPTYQKTLKKILGSLKSL